MHRRPSNHKNARRSKFIKFGKGGADVSTQRARVQQSIQFSRIQQHLINKAGSFTGFHEGPFSLFHTHYFSPSGNNTVCVLAHSQSAALPLPSAFGQVLETSKASGEPTSKQTSLLTSDVENPSRTSKTQTTTRKDAALHTPRKLRTDLINFNSHVLEDFFQSLMLEDYDFGKEEPHTAASCADDRAEPECEGDK